MRGNYPSNFWKRKVTDWWRDWKELSLRYIDLKSIINICVYLYFLFVCFTKDQNRIKGSCVCSVAQLCPILYDPMDCVAHSAPLSMGLYRQEHWSGLPFPFPGDLPDPGIEPPPPPCPTAQRFLHWQVDSLPLCHLESPKWKWKWKSLSHVWLFATPQTKQSMEVSRPEYWRG